MCSDSPKGVADVARSVPPPVDRRVLGACRLRGRAPWLARVGQAGDKPKRVALLVGVNRYKTRILVDKPLSYAERDVEGLAEVLRGQGFEVRTLVTGDSATKAGIDAALDRVLKGREATDLVLLAFAGHGVQMPLVDDEGKPVLDARGKPLGDAYFCPVNAVFGRGESMVSLTRLFERLDLEGGINLVLVDACRDNPDPNRSLGGRVRSLSGDELNGRLPGNSAILFSCSAGQRSLETARAGGGHGVFIHHVIEGLKGQAADPVTGEVGWDDLVSFVRKNVNPRAREWEPELAREADRAARGRLQDPHQISNMVATPVLARVDLESQAGDGQGRVESHSTAGRPTGPLPTPARRLRRVDRDQDPAAARRGVLDGLARLGQGRTDRREAPAPGVDPRRAGPGGDRGHRRPVPPVRGRRELPDRGRERRQGGLWLRGDDLEAGPEVHLAESGVRAVGRPPGGRGQPQRRGRVLPLADAEGWPDLPPADRGGVGVRLPRGDRDPVFQRRRPRRKLALVGNVAEQRQAEAKTKFPTLDKSNPGGRRLHLHGAGGPVREERLGGFSDMHGNVREWCLDWYGLDYYKGSPAADPDVGPSSAASRVFRGGCWSIGRQVLPVGEPQRQRPRCEPERLGLGVPGGPSPVLASNPVMQLRSSGACGQRGWRVGRRRSRRPALPEWRAERAVLSHRAAKRALEWTISRD